MIVFGKTALKLLFSQQIKRVDAHPIAAGHINSAVRLDNQAVLLVSIGILFLEPGNELVDRVLVVHVNSSDLMRKVLCSIGITHHCSLSLYFTTVWRICQADLRLLKLPLLPRDRPSLARKPAVVPGDVSPLVLRVAVRSLAEILVDILLPPELNARSGEALLVPGSVGDNAAVLDRKSVGRERVC